MKLQRMLFTLAMACVAAIPVLAHAACGSDPECDQIDVWSRFTGIDLKVSERGSDITMTWKGRFNHEKPDIVIDMDIRDPGAPMKGTVAMVSGRIMMTKGLKLPPGMEIDVIDMPVLSMKLAMILLGRAFPSGVDSIVGTVPIDRRGEVGIKYATPSASGYISAPWQVKGSVTKDKSGAISFDLTLSEPAEKGGKDVEQSNTRMVGRLYKYPGQALEDKMSLDGWITYGVGPTVEKQANATKFDYGAKPNAQSSFKTVADIRAYVAEQNNPGTADPTKDFTGFWKEKCEDSFGLRITRGDAGGKYSVIFCGPGGCGDPESGRKTFITGDRRFQVVTEGEFIQKNNGGDEARYIRCSKDPMLRLGK